MVKIFEKNEEKILGIKDKDNFLSLKGYIDGISNVVNAYCAQTRWIKCELVKKTISGGHNYFEITDTDENGQKIKSQTAILYSSKSFSVLKKFYNATGRNIEDGMKLLLLLKVSFSTKFGLSFIIEDIDPNFTVGEIEAKHNFIRQVMIEKGYNDLNKKLMLPKHFKRLAVLSPKNAAGLGDFKAEADLMEKYGLCRFSYFTAKFEGDGVEESITSALKEIYESGVNNYDALVFIRGGGSTSSLQSLNEIKIIAYICKFPIPVISGIGHERDKVLIDEFVKLSIDTPSKVAEYIFNTNYNNFINAEKNIANIKYNVSNIITRYEKNIYSNYDSIKSQINQNTENKMLNIKNYFSQIFFNLENKINNARLNVNSSQDTIKNKIEIKIEDYKNKISVRYNSIIENNLINTENIKNKVNHFFEIIEMNSHKSVLNKGYTLIKINDKIISSLEVFNHEITKNKDLKIIFKDGEYIIKGDKNGN